MKKTSLLSLLAFSFCGLTSTIQAGEDYWIIKDGVLNEDIVQLPYDSKDVAVYDTLVSGQKAPDGVTAAAYLHRGAQYKDVRFDLSKAPLDLTKAWILEVEYMAPFAIDSVNPDFSTYLSYKEASLLDGTKSGLRMGLDHNKDSMAVDNMDAAFSIQLVYDALKNGDEWTTRNQFVYANPDSLMMNIFVLSYLREGKHDLTEEPLYIKNLKFKAEFDSQMNSLPRPFYAEDFNPAGSSVTADYSNTSVGASTPELWHGGIIPEGANVSCTRFWDKPYDKSGMFAADMPHSMTVASMVRDIKNIAIPQEYINDGKFGVKILIKSNPNKKQADAWTVALDSASLRPMPAITITFDDANSTAVTLFAGSALEGIWTWNDDIVNVPLGATHCSLNFGAAAPFNYAVSQIRMGSPISVSTPDFEAEGVETLIYVNGESIIAEGATKIEVLSMNGVVLASANGSSVNASGLVDGVYIVRAFSANGVTAQTIIKK